MRHFRILLILLAALVLPTTASAQGARYDGGGCKPRLCDESGWLFDDNGTSHTTSWRHDLGAIPRRVEIHFSPDPADGTVYPLMWSMTSDSTGNPISIDMDRRFVRLHIYNGAPLHGVWTPQTQWKKYREGYWKIIVYR